MTRRTWLLLGGMVVGYLPSGASASQRVYAVQSRERLHAYLAQGCTVAYREPATDNCQNCRPTYHLACPRGTKEVSVKGSDAKAILLLPDNLTQVEVDQIARLIRASMNPASARQAGRG